MFHGAMQFQFSLLTNFTLNFNQQLCLLGGPGSDTCHGDSGGPIIVMDQRGPYLVGVISIGQVICGSDRPSVNTLVKPYIPWIIETILPYEPNFEKMLDKQRQYTPSNFEDYQTSTKSVPPLKVKNDGKRNYTASG